MTRPSARQRGYDRQWEKARADFLKLRRYCALCPRPAVHVHHSVPHKGNPSIFWNRALWVPLCEEHHNRDAQQVEVRGYSSRIGCDGIPTDPNHPFNRGRGSKSSGTFASGPVLPLKPELVAPALSLPGVSEGGSARPVAEGGIAAGHGGSRFTAHNPASADRIAENA